MNFADRLDAAVRTKGNPCLVGLDPHLDLLPEEFAAARAPETPRAERAALVGNFLCGVIDVVGPLVPAIKPQSAFFETLGADGIRAWERVVRAARDAGLIVIGDLKRGDIGSTAKAYAAAYLDGSIGADEGVLCDAITVNPFLGGDAMRPFLEAARTADAGLFVLVRTSNPGSADFQKPSLSDQVARAVTEWGAELVGESGLSSVGAVVGATHAAELAHFRDLLPNAPILLPGYGAQGAGAADVVPAFLADGRGALVSASRSVVFAPLTPREHWQDAIRRAAREMIADVRAALTNGS